MRGCQGSRQQRDGAPYCKIPALSMWRTDPGWRAQLGLSIPQDLDACMILDDQEGDERYMVDDMVIYCYGRIFLTRVSSLKEKFLHAAHEDFLAMHLDAYFSLLEEFTWEGIHHDIYHHMEICIAQMVMKRRSQAPP